jgi:pimeloyl-ACP methyl ester carboxylesterase
LIKFGPEHPDKTYVMHNYEELSFDSGEVVLNYVTAGSRSDQPILLIPGQTESWWGYEVAIDLLSDYYNVYAVDLRGQGRSTRTPGRYTFDNFGNDLVRFIEAVIQRPTIVSGLSSGGVIAAWLSAYAPPEMILAAHYEDPPLFAAELSPACGPGIRQGAGPLFFNLHKYLGSQWTIGDVDGLLSNAKNMKNQWVGLALVKMVESSMQSLKEYDPEWGHAFWTGSATAGCDHQDMLARVTCPVLFTHHARTINDKGNLVGAISDIQVALVKELVERAGQEFEYQSFPKMPHSMHGANPELFAKTVHEWAARMA